MEINKIKVIAMDLDGTLTQHKEMLSNEHMCILNELSKKYKLIMVGAGQVMRIFNQMRQFPIDIIGNYGLQYATYNANTKTMDIKRDLVFPVDKNDIESKVNYFRDKYGHREYCGDNVEYHISGCITFPILGTKAKQEDKLSFDPDRKKRRLFYDEVCSVFSNYNVFVGGSSSFDMSPKPYNKYFALDIYCKENNLSHESVVYIGDDYGYGGNDESVYKSDFNFLTIDNFRDFKSIVKALL